MSSPPPAPAGDLVDRLLNGRYRVTRFIAAGGMAQVWEADDSILARKVAVKILRPGLAADTQFVARFRAEAISAARLSHPAIVSIYDTWTDDNLEAIVMELVQGSTLRALLDEKHKLDIADALAIAGHVADALSAAHEAGLVHRDVKPANVLLSDDGRVLVTDFGIAKATESADITTESVMLGTAKYLAPEQVEGTRVDARSDIYALGVVLYEMLCGRAPFQEDTDTATALARLRRDPTSPLELRPDLPPAVVEIINRSLARNPDHRYSSAVEMQRAIVDARRVGSGPSPEAAHRAGAGLPVGAPPGPSASPATGAAAPGGAGPYAPAPGQVAYRAAPGQAPRPGRKSPVPVAIGVLVTLALAVAGLLVFDAGNDKDNGGLGDGIRDAILGDPDKPAAAAPKITDIAAFDPEGTPVGQENNDLVGLAVDGDAATAWKTERYTNPSIDTKPGVGIYVTLEKSSDLGKLIVTAPTSGWAADVFVVDGEPGKDLAAWGQPVTSREGIGAGTAEFDLGGKKGSAVLLWITHTGDGRVEISELTVEAPS